MVWYKPSTWGKKSGTTTTTSSTNQNSSSTLSKSSSVSFPTGTSGVSITPSGLVSSSPSKSEQLVSIITTKSGGGGGSSTSSQLSTPTDASYTQGTSVYNPATKTLEQNKIILPKTNKTIISKPYLSTIEPAPTFTQQYSTAREKYGYIQGTLYFAGEKIKGKIATSKFSPFKEDYYKAQSVGKLSALTIETAPYFAPYVGGALITGASIENIGTSSGRARITATSEYLKTKGVPSYISTPAQYGLNIGGAVLGGKILTSDISKGLGFPKYQTQLLGTSKVISDNQIVTQTGFKTTQRNLFTTKEFYGTATGKSSFKTISTGELTTGENIIFGKYAKFTNAGIPKSEKSFNIISSSLSKPDTSIKTIDVLYPQKQSSPFFKIKGYRGTSTLEFGKIAIAKESKFYISPTKSFFTGKGVSFEKYPNVLGIKGMTSLVEEGKFLKRGKGTFSGFVFSIKSIKPSEVRFIQTGGKKSSPKFFNNLYSLQDTQLLKTSTGISSVVSSKETKIIPTPRFLGGTTSRLTTTSKINQKNIYTQSLGQIQITKQSSKLKEDLGFIYSGKQKNKLGLRGISSISPISSTKQVLFQPQAFKSVEILKPTGRLKTPSPFPFSNVPSFPTTSPPFIIPSFSFGADFKMSTKIFKGKQPKKYTPSFEVISGLRTGKSYVGKRLTGLETRGFSKGFTWSYNVPKIKFKGFRL